MCDMTREQSMCGMTREQRMEEWLNQNDIRSHDQKMCWLRHIRHQSVFWNVVENNGYKKQTAVYSPVLGIGDNKPI